MKKAIALTAYNRPKLLEQVLDSIMKLKNLKDGWSIWILADPSDQSRKIKQIVKKFSSRFADLNFCVNDTKQGIQKNPYKLLQWCFANGAELVFYLEDDLLVSNDCLLLSNLILSPMIEKKYLCLNLSNTTCTSTAVFTPNKNDQDVLSHYIIENKFFSSCGIMMSKAQYLLHFEPNWYRKNLKIRNFVGDKTQGWDLAINDYLIEHKDLYVLQSLVPRVLHIGIEGVHVGESFQNLTFSHIKLFQRKKNQKNKTFKIIDYNSKKLEFKKYGYVRSYLNLSKEINQLQVSRIEVEDHLNKKINDQQLFIKNQKTYIKKQKAHINNQDTYINNIKERLNKKSIRWAEKIATIVNKFLRRN